MHPESVIKAVSWVILLPFYIYALIKWHQFRSHFLIRNRFPKISYTLFYIVFLGQTVSLIEGCLHDLHVTSDMVNYHVTYAVLSLTFTTSGLTLYRINLIYLRWKSSHSISNNEPVASHSVYQSTLFLSFVTFGFICVGSVVLYVTYCVSLNYNHRKNVSPFIICEFSVLSVLIGASICNIERKHVAEGIGCINECYAILISLVVQMVFEIAFPYSASNALRVLECSTFYMLNYQAIVTLYIPLYLLYKSEGTLDISVYQNELNVQIFTNKKSSKNNAKRNDEKTDFNDIFEQSTKQKTMNTPKTIELVANASESGQSADQDTIMINESLFTFLYHNQVNHKVFSEYLRFCFAIENLLFVERVSVLYQIVLGMKQKSDVMLSEISGSDIDAESPRSRASPTNLPSCSEFEFCVEDAAMHRLEFRYLTSIYERYQRIIDDAVKADDERCDIEKYKKALFDICQEIYDEFISCFAETQLNLGSGVQERLELILGGVRGDGMVQFKSYDDFMTLFDGALIETYGLMISAYLFQFKKYVRTRFSHVQFE